ncbi:MAG: peptidoglycan-binding domain-containing protein [Candidatus Taylorbacteria bacterium]|nr:peptidoglycan-binding domain-containing protein [Candidatus Taylorbacteria bacterium]
MKKALSLGFIIAVVALVGVQTASAQYGYGGGGGSSSGGSGPACIYGYNFSTFSCNPAPVVTTPVVGRVLGATTFAFTNYLRQGNTSDAVRQLQERLRAEGHFTYPTSTGYFGPITFTAVQAYQSAHGIPNTGFVGSMTIASLNSNNTTASATPVDCPVGYTCTPIANTASVVNALTQ